MANTLSALPESFSAGTTVSYTKTVADYPADGGWTLTLYLAGVRVYDVEATADGSAHEVTIPATAPLVAGIYKWSERVSKSGEVYEVGYGTVSVSDNLAEATDGSAQEWLERTVPILRSHVEGRLAAGLESYSIAGRAVSKIPVVDAIALLTRLEGQLKRLKNPGVISRPGVISFVEPGIDQ